LSVLLNHGSGNFAPGGRYSVGVEASSVVATDLNEDGRADVAIANRSASDVSVLFNTGGGVLSTAVNYGVGSFPFAITAADLNADFKPDLVVANWEGGDLSLLLNRGGGKFGASIDYAAASSFQWLVTADLNGDAAPDLAGTSLDGFMSVLSNRGNGTFEPEINYPTGVSPSSLAVADLNRDDLPDLAVAWSGGIQVFDNRGQSFAPPVNRSTVTGLLAAADFDGNGTTDLVVAANDAYVRVLSNRGDGTLEEGAPYASMADPSSVSVADVDADGRPDLVLGSWTSDTACVLLNRTGGFAPPVLYAVGSGARSLVATADLDGDSYPDLAVANGHNFSWQPVSDDVTVLLNRGDGTFVGPIAAYATGAPNPVFVAASDLDGDGDPDLGVINNDQRHPFSVLINNGDGGFASGIPYAGGDGLGYGAIVAADLNVDGRHDLVAVGGQGMSVFMSTCLP
jgi:hypothetical protein